MKKASHKQTNKSRYIPLALLSLGFVAATAVLGLTTGFVPIAEGPEVRRIVNTNVVTASALDMPDPILPASDGKRIWAVRESIGQLSRSDSKNKKVSNIDEKQKAGSQAQQMVAFENNKIRLAIGEEGLVLDNVRGKGTNSLASLLSLDGFSMPNLIVLQPSRYGDPLDMNGRPLRWQSVDLLLVGLMRLAPKTSSDNQDATSPNKRKGLDRPQQVIVIREPAYIDGGRLHSRAGQYRDIVETFAGKYNLSVPLIFAIIHSESDFTTTLVSRSKAMGLMQLLPSTASGEIHRYLYGQRGQVTFDDLRVPEINIRYGTTYLHILLTRYFQDVQDPTSREYCVIAAYNMGPNRFLRHYGKTNGEAVARFNSMTADELYHDMTSNLPFRETRFYVAKVRKLKDMYSAMK